MSHGKFLETSVFIIIEGNEIVFFNLWKIRAAKWEVYFFIFSFNFTFTKFRDSLSCVRKWTKFWNWWERKEMLSYLKEDLTKFWKINTSNFFRKGEKYVLLGKTTWNGLSIQKRFSGNFSFETLRRNKQENFSRL